MVNDEQLSFTKKEILGHQLLGRDPPFELRRFILITRPATVNLLDLMPANVMSQSRRGFDGADSLCCRVIISLGMLASLVEAAPQRV